MLLLRTCFFAFFLATLPVALLHAQTAPPQSDSLPKVGFAIIKTSQVAVAQALLVPGGSGLASVTFTMVLSCSRASSWPCAGVCSAIWLS